MAWGRHMEADERHSDVPLIHNRCEYRRLNAKGEYHSRTMLFRSPPGRTVHAVEIMQEWYQTTTKKRNVPKDVSK
jgi:hypothetical protein